MHELQFAEAAVPFPATVMDIPLRPYSLGHELILLARHNPILCLAREDFDRLSSLQQIHALMFALEVCAPQRPRWWLWKILHRQPNWALGVAEFRNYLEAGRRSLPVLSAENKEDAEAYDIANGGDGLEAGRELGSPTIAHLIHYAIAELRLTHAEALESPYGYVAGLYLAQLEAKGQLFVENTKEATVKAEMKAELEFVQAEKAAARAAWDAAGTDETAQRVAYAAHPRIGNLFADDWYAAGESDAARSAVVEKWGFVAETELAKANITMKEVV